ncbi:D-glucuronyl c5-epimerase [Plakobranchus ocellatus]|uniref:heparosan-N-sulfate-glucuronate 5-epimerase n=1 Tax=Plakobranchus ocellatus TaxID=259542 RepID=A0AAV4DDM2_9GAST|nr:D-glucuronyl c5-epimerase [Plakobranchus ocellatus]
MCAPCPRKHLPQDVMVAGNSTGLTTINCSVNGEYNISCRKDGEDVFMPVSFINKFFEVYGKIASEVGHGSVYNFRSFYGALNPIQKQYSPNGIFLNFEKYNVEARTSILCVTAAEGVPVTIQWDKAGYFYAISIAQFSLSHHAKALVEGTPVTKPLVGHDIGLERWEQNGPGSRVYRAVDTVAGLKRPVLAFDAHPSATEPGPRLPLDTHERALSFSIKLLGPGGITVKIRTRQNTVGYVSYFLVDPVMEIRGNSVTYGLKVKNKERWVRLARDVFVDWLKAAADTKNSSNWFDEMLDITLHGNGSIDNMTISKNVHYENFIQGSNWLVENQDTAGGWPTSIPVKTRGIQLPPNWYSAMAQGQAMSALVRAYNLTLDHKYLTAAVKAMKLLTKNAKDGGVRTRFLGRLDWYEEYPTIPSTFVLNGFVFSLLGLYDVMKTAKGSDQKLAEKLWTSGVRSLKTMLGLFDTGDGTLYDLRHVISHEAPNRARWDYHVTHIALIQQMAAIDGDPIFHRAAERWTAYFRGEKSPHN